MSKGKVIKLDAEEVVIANEDETTTRAPYNWLNFRPEIGDQVEVFSDGEELIIHKAESKKDSIEDKININIVNENNQNQNMNGYMNGRIVNKWVYFLLAFFLGGIGAHKFFSGFFGKGVIYFIFSWTFIPMIIAFFTAISTLLKSADQNGNIVIYS